MKMNALELPSLEETICFDYSSAYLMLKFTDIIKARIGKLSFDTNCSHKLPKDFVSDKTYIALLIVLRR